jgi:hypothetical protein
LDIIQSLSMSNMTNKNGIVYYWYFIFQIVISRGFVITEILYRNVDQGCHSRNLKRLLLPKVMQLSKQIKKELKTAMYFILSSTSKRRIYTCMRCVRDFTVVTICWQQNNICNEIVVVKYYLKFTRLCTLFNSRRTSTEDTYAPALVWNIKYQ